MDILSFIDCMWNLDYDGYYRLIIWNSCSSCSLLLEHKDSRIFSNSFIHVRNSMHVIICLEGYDFKRIIIF